MRRLSNACECGMCIHLLVPVCEPFKISMNFGEDNRPDYKLLISSIPLLFVHFTENSRMAIFGQRYTILHLALHLSKKDFDSDTGIISFQQSFPI